MQELLEWSTTYILPWIALYWFIRLVKGIEKTNYYTNEEDLNESQIK
ncbi:hypothetical protein [Filobacillus milosensis]|nr:hypothetical protein [Filobacillus milosensis]